MSHITKLPFGGVSLTHSFFATHALQVILSAVNLMFVKLESIQSKIVEAAVTKKFGTKLSGEGI